jgi:hypothetical protein
MTIEKITQTLQRVADNQAKHDEMHARHSADIAEIDRVIVVSLESQSRYDKQLARMFEVMGDLADVMSDLADKQLKNEELFAEAQMRLEGGYDLLEVFVRESRNETRDYFAETDKKLSALAVVQAGTAELLAECVKETNGRFVETDKRLAELARAQTRTDEMVRAMLERNGSTDKLRTTVKKAKKASKKAPAKKKGARAK